MLKYANYDIVFQEFPDEVTLAVNLSLCPNACPGCHSAYLAGDVGSVLDEAAISALVAKYEGAITCFGFMGGDNDPAAVARLAAYVKSLGLKTGWYSGRADLPYPHFPLTDFNYIKLGAWVEALGPLNERTTNQRMLKISPSGEIENITARFWKR